MTENVSQPNTTNPYSARGLIEFLDAAIEKGWLNDNSTKALKTACQKVLGIEEGWEDLDLRELDQDDIYERFRNLKRNDYSDASMRIYRSRMGQAIKMHLARMDNDPAWKSYAPGGRSNSDGSAPAKKASARKASSSAGQAAPKADTAAKPPESTINGSTGTPPAKLMHFPFPLRDDLDVQLILPRDLSQEEAERLSRYISTLARVERKAITAGN